MGRLINKELKLNRYHESLNFDDYKLIDMFKPFRSLYHEKEVDCIYISHLNSIRVKDFSNNTPFKFKRRH